MSDASAAFFFGVGVCALTIIVVIEWADGVQDDRAWPMCAAESAQLRDATDTYAVCERSDGSLIAVRVGSPK